MPLLLAGQTEGWKLHLQLTNGNFIRAGATDRLRLAGALATDPLNPNNSSTHLFASDDTTHLCSVHGNNTARLTNTTASINGGGSSALPIAQSNCSFLLSFFSLSEITTSNARIYSYNGTTDATPIPGVNMYLAEGGVSSSWASVNGSANMLTLADQTTPDVEHNYWIACSASTSGGAGTSTTGAFKILISYV